MDFDTAWNQFAAYLQEQAVATGQDLLATAEEVAEYAAGRAQHLSTLVNEPGFNEALAAERDNLALFAGLRGVDSADAVDARINGVVEGALAFVSAALSAAL